MCVRGSGLHGIHGVGLGFTSITKRECGAGFRACTVAGFGLRVVWGVLQAQGFGQGAGPGFSCEAQGLQGMLGRPAAPGSRACGQA